MQPLIGGYRRRTGLLNWIVTQHSERWLIDVSHHMDLPAPDLAKAQAALSKKSCASDLGR